MHLIKFYLNMNLPTFLNRKCQLNSSVCSVACVCDKNVECDAIDKLQLWLQKKMLIYCNIS